MSGSEEFNISEEATADRKVRLIVRLRNRDPTLDLQTDLVNEDLSGATVESVYGLSSSQMHLLNQNNNFSSEG